MAVVLYGGGWFTIIRMTVLYEDIFGRDRVVLMGRLLMGFPVALHTHLTGVNRDEVSELKLDGVVKSDTNPS